MNKTINWYAVRTIFHFGNTAKEKYIYEERIVVFCGKNFDEAFEKAVKESIEYDRAIGPKRQRPYSIKSAYQQDGDSLIDGYEVWSELNESNLKISSFYKEKYLKFNYKPR